MRTLGAQKLPVTALRANPGNVRTNLGDLTELTASIAAQGVMQPLIVTRRATPGGGVAYVVLDGHRRLAAARAAGVRDVMCLLAHPESSEQEAAQMLAAAMHKGLEPVEQARAFKRLRDQGWPTKRIAQQTGHSPGLVHERLALLDLPPQAQQLVEEKKVTLTAAKDLGRQLRRSASGSAATAGPKNAYLDRTHPAADDARARCTEGHREHRRIVGGVSCGQCFEAAILARAGVTL